MISNESYESWPRMGSGPGKCKKFFGKAAKVNEECMEEANNKTRGDYSGNCGEMYLIR